MIAAAEDAAGFAAEESRERRAELLCHARGTDELRRQLAEQTATIAHLRHQLSHARELENACAIVLRPFVNKPSARPKWAHHLHATLQRIGQGLR